MVSGKLPFAPQPSCCLFPDDATVIPLSSPLNQRDQFGLKFKLCRTRADWGIKAQVREPQTPSAHLHHRSTTHVHYCTNVYLLGNTTIPICPSIPSPSHHHLPPRPRWTASKKRWIAQHFLGSIYSNPEDIRKIVVVSHILYYTFYFH